MTCIVSAVKIALFVFEGATAIMGLYTQRLKNVTTLSCYNFDVNKSILIIFGRSLTEKVIKRLLIFPPHLVLLLGKQDTRKMRVFI